MPDAEASALDKLVGSIGDSLESSVLSACTDPLVGWVSTFIGLGGDGDGTAASLQTIGQTLSGLQTDLNGILTDITALKGEIRNDISAAAFALQVQKAVAVVQNYQSVMNTESVLADTFTNNMNQLTAVNDALVGDGGASSITGYLSKYLQANLRYYSDGSPLWLSLYPFFQYYQAVQAVLMQMAVEAAHQGQPPPQNPLSFNGSQSVLGYPPPNYQGAADAYTRYTENVAQQRSFIPFPTTGVGGLNQHQDGWGVDQIVFDRVAGIAWGFRNFGSTYGGIAPPSLGSVYSMQFMVSNPDTWMLRVPAYDELVNFRASLQDPNGQPVTATTIVPAMQQLGFDVNLPPGAVGIPYATNECLQAANWTFLDLGSVTVGGGGEHGIPGRVLPTAAGYQSSWFYDLLNGVGMTLQISCPLAVSSLVLNQTVPGEGMFTDIQLGTQVGMTTVNGSSVVSSPGTTGYLDALFIYQLANAHAPANPNTDPPVEEPSSLQINPPVTSPDGSTMQFTVSGTFQRFDYDTRAYVPVSLGIASVYWSVGGADGPATIDQSGLLTWKRQGSVTVVAGRGPLTNTMLVSAPPSFSPTITPSKVNISPREFKANESVAKGLGVTFNGQIVWSDGRTSAFGDNGTTSNFAEGGDAVPTFTYTFAEASGRLTPDSGQTSSFTLPVGTTSNDKFQINVTINGNAQLMDNAKIAIL